MSPAKLATGFVSIALVLTVPGPVRGQTCASDADCGQGFRCQTNALATPSTAPCYVVDGGGCAPVAVPAPTSSCQAAACASDADCGANMICNRQISTTCTGMTPVATKCDPNLGGCDAGAEIVPTPVMCTDTVTSRCAYRWELPCNADADCGSGFTCQPATAATCTGSAGAPATGGAGVGGGSGSAPPIIAFDAGPAPTCTVVSSYPGRCLAKTITCASAADCPSGWTCPTASPGTTTVAAPTAPVGAPVPAADPYPVDAGSAPVIASSLCRPPSTGGTVGEWGGSDGTQTKGPVAVVTDAGTATGSNTPPTPTVPPSGGGRTSEQQPVASTTSGGGCSVGSGADAGLASTLGLLALFALFALGRGRVSGNKR